MSGVIGPLKSGDSLGGCGQIVMEFKHRNNEDKRETKTAGWVDYLEHPEGVLSKPCEVCGYKYGTSWLKKDVPAEVIAYIESLPGTDLKPAWI